ncbi:MAG: hypothetical protein C5B49_01010 [Bdellovibrio sp.]|nr:MAG: hypothetical protein C5B49_01010 [Bdellovibrio sp.]
MKRVPLFSMLVVSSCISSCKSAQKSHARYQVSDKPSSALTSKEWNERLQRDLNRVVEKRNEIDGRMATTLPSSGEQSLYNEMVAAYERNDELSFQPRFQRMMADHAKSVWADDAIYLAGMLKFSNKQYGQALQLFAKILENYPESNKARAALFAKGAAYRQMNLLPQAKEIFEQVQSRFPGSPESRRADVELRIMK